MADTVIQLKGVSKVFGKKLILDQVNLDINKGEIFGVIGASGCGKTTLLNLMIGFLEPEEGDVIFRRSNNPKFFSIYRRGDIVKKIFGFASQSPSYYPELTVAENMNYFASLYALPSKIKRNNIKNIIEIVGLANSQKEVASNLSGGMKKRLDIACSIINSPEILILDEPTADLDPVLRKQFWDVIRDVNRRGTTIILASHFLEDVENVCDRLAILNDRKIIHVGTPVEITKIISQYEEITIETIPGNYATMAQELEKIRDSGIQKIMKSGTKLIIYTSKSELVLHDILHIIEKLNENLLEVNLSKPSLNEVMASIGAQK
ncbi:MAG TPA: ABC transporter ATP-binding protein [Candidatus Nanoarchaeia archaeon]|nr:ABC transporter ATP-binding protein [Candidatus Nanoarchaeia archaeon]